MSYWGIFLGKTRIEAFVSERKYQVKPQSCLWLSLECKNNLFRLGKSDRSDYNRHLFVASHNEFKCVRKKDKAILFIYLSVRSISPAYDRFDIICTPVKKLLILLSCSVLEQYSWQ